MGCFLVGAAARDLLIGALVCYGFLSGNNCFLHLIWSVLMPVVAPIIAWNVCGTIQVADQETIDHGWGSKNTDEE